MASAALIGRVSAWYATAARDLPWRSPGASPWAVLVSEVMLQQTPVARVLPAYGAWMARWPTPAALAAASPGDAVRLWGRLGYPRRALRLHAAAVQVVERYDGVLPDAVDELLTLPGVGDYTARAVAAFAFGQRQPVVDTNVRRVVARAVEGSGGGSVRRSDLALVAGLLPLDAPAAATASIALMELGALVCTARNPRCGVCPIRRDCAWLAAGRPEAEPARAGPGYAGTQRQVRGALLAVLRAADEPVTAEQLALAWTVEADRTRAVASLLADGLAQICADGRYALPSS